MMVVWMVMNPMVQSVKKRQLNKSTPCYRTVFRGRFPLYVWGGLGGFRWLSCFNKMWQFSTCTFSVFFGFHLSKMDWEAPSTLMQQPKNFQSWVPSKNQQITKQTPKKCGENTFSRTFWRICSNIHFELIRKTLIRHLKTHTKNHSIWKEGNPDVMQGTTFLPRFFR